MSGRRPVEEIIRALHVYAAPALTALGNAWGTPRSSYPHRQDLVAVLAERIAAGVGLEERIARLQPGEREALAYVGRRAEPVPVRSVLRLLRGQLGAGEGADKTLLDLLRQGLLLYAAGGPWKVDFSRHDPTFGMRQVWAPPAVAAAVQGPGGWAELVPPAPAPSQVRAGDAGELLRDIFLLVRALRARPVRVTQQGTPHQADLRRLVGELRPRADRKTWQAEADGVIFAMALAGTAGLLQVAAEGLVPASAADEFFASDQVAQVARLCSAWGRVGWSELARVPTLVVDDYAGAYSDAPDLEGLQAARRLVTEALTEVADGAWRAVRDLSAAIRHRDPDFLTGGSATPTWIMIGSHWPGMAAAEEHYRGIRRAGLPFAEARLSRDVDWDAVEGAYLRQVLVEPLTWLGMVDTAAAPDGTVAWFRVTPLGVAVLSGGGRPAARGADGAPRLVVQPNFEVIVLDATANLQLLRRLEAFAVPRTVDRAAVYGLTREALTAGLQTGLGLADVEALLEAESGAPLPQNVRYTLQEWTRGFERVSLHRAATLLEVDEPAALDVWLADPTLAAHVRRLSPTVALLSPDGAQALLQRPARDRRPAVEDAVRGLPGALRLADDALTLTATRELGRFERHRLDGLAERVAGSSGRAQFRLTEASLARAAAAGWSGAAVLEFLNSRLGRTPPAETALAVRGWLGELGPVRRAAVHLLRLPDATAWPAIQRAAGGDLAVLLEPTLALVDEPVLARAADALRASGLRIEEAEAMRVAEALVETKAAAAGVALQPLRGRALRDFLDAAIRDKARVILMYQSATQKAPRRIVVQPRYTERRPNGYYLAARAENGAERGYKLDDIFGVAREEQA